MSKRTIICTILFCLSLMICSAALAANSTMFTADTVNVYTSPDTASKVAFKIGKAYEVELVRDVNTTWYEIRFNNRKGYVEKSRLAADDPFIAEIDASKLRFGTWMEPKLKKNELWIPTLYEDEQLTVMKNIEGFYTAAQRVVILENGKKAKKIAVFGVEAYVPARDIGNISTKYKKAVDYSALEQYALTLRANAYRKAYADDPDFASVKYDPVTRKCLIGFKKGTAPNLRLMPGFKLVEYVYTQSDMNETIKIAEALAKKYNLVKGTDYNIYTYNSPIINISFNDVTGAHMEKFYSDMIKAGANPKLFVMELNVV